MLKNRWIRRSLLLLCAGIALLLLTLYANHCQHETNADHKECAGYETGSLLGAFLEAHNGAITAIATAFIAGFTWTLWRAAERLRKAGDKQAELTTIIERAYLSVEPGGIRLYGADDDRMACDIIIHNAGNLAARNMAWFIDRKYSPDAEEDSFLIDPTKLRGDIVLAAKERARKGADPTHREEFTKWTRGEKDRAWLYVWGRVAYHDGFRPGRYIDFCDRYNVRAASTLEIDQEHGRYHEHGNRTDEG